jgi:cytidylate kinase
MTSSGPKFTIVTIDGFAGSGKSTVARLIAQELKFIHLNSGLLYRALALEALRVGIGLDVQANKPEIEALALKTRFDFILDKGDFRTRITVNNEFIEEDSLFTNEAGSGASAVGRLEQVRSQLTDVQRAFAQYKFFLDASLEERARRRHIDEVGRGSLITLNELLESIRERDEADSKREFGPLKIPDGARVVDTDGKSISEVVHEIYQKIFTEIHEESRN